MDALRVGGYSQGVWSCAAVEGNDVALGKGPRTFRSAKTAIRRASNKTFFANVAAVRYSTKVLLCNRLDSLPGESATAI